MNPEEDRELLYIAAWALEAPVPAGWTVHLDADGNEYFSLVSSPEGAAGDTSCTYKHPMDAHYMKLYEIEKKKRKILVANGAL